MSDNVEVVLRDAERHLAPFSHDGAIAETIVSTAQIIQR
ncbi:hypothetical protein ACVIW2_003455 [Bradyrhizobium huanghuaihaiense]